MSEQPTPITSLASRFKELPRWMIILAGVFILVVLVLVGLGWHYQYRYHDRIYRGVMVGQVAVGGLTPEAARSKLQAAAATLEQSPLIFIAGNQNMALPIAPDDLDAGVPLVRFDPLTSADRAFGVGRHGWWGARWWQSVTALVGGGRLPWSVQVNRPQLITGLRAAVSNLPGAEAPGRDAAVVITKNGDTYQATVTPGQRGIVFDYAAVADQVTAQAEQGAWDAIGLVLVERDPIVTTAMATAVAAQVPNLFSQPLTLTFADQSWIVSVDELVAMFAAVPTADEQSAVPGLDPILFDAYLAKEITPVIDRPLQNAKFTMTNGRVTEFVPAQSGRTIDREALGVKISAEFFGTKVAEIEIPVAEVAPVISAADVNDLGIAELIGVGKSNFAGSPKNRRHNIATGAAALNGIIIQPGEEFSLLKTLGAIDGEHGYLPELVIKGNKTTPEYGGGLCQIGTTVFRGTLDAGLPVTMRQNHSYRVSYYEPAGTDATIYDPAPDYRFLNDTDAAVLLQTKIIGDELRFEFWGKQDGRTMYYSGQQESDNFYDIKPKIYNQVSPPPTKLIETLDLPVGTKKCTERAHVGASTDFTYQIKYPDGKLYEKLFTSYYRPWQEVCLIGVEKLTEPEPAPTDETTTPPTDPGADPLAIPVTPETENSTPPTP